MTSTTCRRSFETTQDFAWWRSPPRRNPPYIDQRSFPKELAGPAYEEDIPIVAESELASLIERHRADWVFLAYSDLSHQDVMHKASIALAHGAGFAIAPPRQTQLRSERPVLAITAARTGAGKSPVTQWLAAHLRARGLRVGVLRHPMPYGDLRKQSVQRFGDRSGPRRARMHHRRARRVRALRREGTRHLRWRRLPLGAARSRRGVRRDPLGRRKQRPVVHRSRSLDRRVRRAQTSATKWTITPARPTFAAPTC